MLQPAFVTNSEPRSAVVRLQPAACGLDNGAIFYSRFKGTTAAVNRFIGTRPNAPSLCCVFGELPLTASKRLLLTDPANCTAIFANQNDPSNVILLLMPTPQVG